MAQRTRRKSLRSLNGKLPVFAQLHQASVARALEKTEALGPGDLSEVFGQLKKLDRYALVCNNPVNNAFWDNEAIDEGYDISFDQPRYGRMLLKNVAYVKTFVTDAAYDLIIYSAATPKALSLHTDILDAVVHQTGPRSGVARPGWMVLKYKPGAFPDIADLKTRTIRFPFYATSCHSVAVTQPRELFWDVSAWMNGQ